MEKTYVLPWWSRILIGIAVAGIMLWKLPMLEILTIFFYFFLVPLAFLGAIGMVAGGTIDAMGANWDKFGDAVRERVSKERERLNRDASPTPDA